MEWKVQELSLAVEDVLAFDPVYRQYLQCGKHLLATSNPHLYLQRRPDQSARYQKGN